MKSYKRTVKYLARCYRRNPDDLLCHLWYFPGSDKRFNYLVNENSVIKDKHVAWVKNVLRADTIVESRVVKPVPLKVDVRPRNYDFSTCGRHVDSLEYLTVREVIAIHGELARDVITGQDPIFPAGIKNENSLHSAIFHPQTSFEGKYKYTTVEVSGAALMYSLSNNHPFHNGNKRTALVSLIVFLDRHNISLTCGDDDLFRISMDVAMHNLFNSTIVHVDDEIYMLSEWIVANSKLIKKGERIVTFRKLERILKNLGCVYNEQHQRFERLVTETGFLGIKRTITLSYKLSRATIRPGEEVDKGVLSSLRQDLRLDVENGFDAEAFYDGNQQSTGEFIHKYRKVLERLAKV